MGVLAHTLRRPALRRPALRLCLHPGGCGKNKTILVGRVDRLCFLFAPASWLMRTPVSVGPSLWETSVPPSHPQGTSQETRSF